MAGRPLKRPVRPQIAAQISEFPAGDDCAAYQTALQVAALQIDQAMHNAQVKFHNNDDRRNLFDD